LFLLHFDMRAPGFGAPIGELYAAALEMSAWGEKHGCLSIAVSEHHTSDDGYLPSPLILAAAIAARTATVPIQVAALVVPLHGPVDLAEQMAVLDVLSGGRVSYVCAAGYRREEFEAFGRDIGARGRDLESAVQLFRKAWTGEPFEHDGRTVRVTPKPLTAGGPMLLLGGNSKAAVRRAARLGLGMITQGGDPSLEQVYLDTCRDEGLAPGMFVNPPPGFPTTCFVAEDLDRAWREIGPHLLHDARSYAEWLGEASAAAKSTATTVDELRAENGAYRILTPEQAVESIRTYGAFVTKPLCGGIPPALAWRSLELLAAEALPALAV
jgi:alkanesulfonate monooxygenase SsuD/methylene tetrahydromethanopterin reductase-like flavin-dependent oxidoreductase (luciferase family)